MHEKSLKVVSLILLVLFIVALSMPLALRMNRPGSQASGWEVVAEFPKLIGALIVLGLSNERGVELLKTFGTSSPRNGDG